jgi:exoribonuclease-2
MSDRIAVGVIRKPHGVRGEASVEPWTDSADRFEMLEAVTLVSPDEKKIREVRVEHVRPHGERALMKFAGIESPEEVTALHNWTVEIPEADARALDEFLRERRRADPERFPDLSLSVVKLLGSGEYALVRAGGVPEGHFGLAVRDYAHSTAPNRRYPDLVTQRLLKAAIAGAPVPYREGELEAIAADCTAREDEAEKVERQVRKSAAAMLLEGRAGEQFDAIVTGASDKGTWVRIHRPAVEGRVVKGESGLDVGERTRVKLLRTDVERGFIDFARV